MRTVRKPDQETSVGYPEPLLRAHGRARGIRRALPAAACGRPDSARLDHRAPHPGQLRGLPRYREEWKTQTVRLVSWLAGPGACPPRPAGPAPWGAPGPP